MTDKGNLPHITKDNTVYNIGSVPQPTKKNVSGPAIPATKGEAK